MNKQELDMLKDKYALGTLTEIENASLEVELLQNPELEKELKSQKKLMKAIRYSGDLELREKLSQIHLEESGEKSSEVKRLNLFYYVAGFLLLIGVSSYFIWNNESDKEMNTAVLYADFYQKYNSSLLDRGISIDEAISTFNAYYSKGQYQEALETIKPFLADSDNEVKLIAAIAANEIDDLILAERLLNAIIESEDYYFIDHAIWYKALIKLKTKDILSIKEILVPLIDNPKADHHNEAKSLLSRLKQ